MKKFLVAAAVVVLAAFAVPAFAATNPFMDVPASHWAYDAVAQLASRGIISGYPTGDYKGAQPTTRYEMASVIARALAQIDIEKASKQEVELMKKLILEFRDELDALNVKVDGFDERLGVIEKDLGGWSIAGEFRFDANFGMDDANNGWYGDDMVQYGENDFDLNRYRIFLRKRINDTTSFTARIGTDGGTAVTKNPGMRWERYFITTELGYGVTLTTGLLGFDWEGDAGLYGANAAFIGDYALNAFLLQKDWGKANIQFVLGRFNDDKGAATAISADRSDHRWTEGNYGRGVLYEESFLAAAKIDFNVVEKLNAGVMAYYRWADESVVFPAGTYDPDDSLLTNTAIEGDSSLLTIGAYFTYNFTESIALKGLYYHQRLDDVEEFLAGGDDNANAWKVAIDVNQDALKFTSLWLEYAQIDNNFYIDTNVYAFNGANLLANRDSVFDRVVDPDNKTKVYGAVANQQWNDKWRTYLGYYRADYDTRGVDDATNWTLGVAYRLNPAVEFELSYDSIDYGDTNTGTVANPVYNGGGRWDDDQQIRFRTYVSF
jgi:hypothetical protein